MMAQDNTSGAKREGPQQTGPAPAANIAVNAATVKRQAAKAADRAPPVKKPAVKADARAPAARKPAVKADAKAVPTKRQAAKAPSKVLSAKRPAVKATARPFPSKKPAPKAPAKARTVKRSAGAPPAADKRLPGMRAAAGELSRALDAVEKARAALEETFSRAAAGNLARAQGALETLRRLASTGPLLDVRRLERELAVLVEDVGDLREREGKGRKRDLLAVDEFLGDAAARLEMAATPAAGSHLKLLSERLSGLEALRRSHQAAVNERFRARLVSSRKVLGTLPDSCVRLNERALGCVVRELESALALSKAFPVGKLQGKPGDLYGIDGLVKRLDRRMARVQALLARRKEPSDG